MGVFAEVDYSRIKTRLDQGWVDKVSGDLDEVFAGAKAALEAQQGLSVAYHGNIVDLLEYAVRTTYTLTF